MIKAIFESQARVAALAAFLLAFGFRVPAGEPAAKSSVLNRSDVIFMYQATPQTYRDYGATVLAWGGKPTPRSLEEAKGVTFFGSVGMVTEFARYYERFPQTYDQGLCRDVQGNPIKVPWLTDHQHKGIPFWWCCPQQPQFRRYLQERVVETVKAGADGVHIDDHLGSAGGLWTGTCFCDRCLEGFRDYLKTLPEPERGKLGMENLETFNYREFVRQWLQTQGTRKTSVNERPGYQHWQIYQCREAARFMQELRVLAAATAQHPVPMSANAGVLWPLHLVDYQSLDFFSAEIDHGAAQRRFSDLPLMAYRLAEGMGRPLAATASGGDWAFVKEHNLPGLVCGWIATSYAAGHFLMAPHRQWCYTPEKGTHWYQGPKEKFAPLYQFVRQHAALFDDYQTQAELGVVLAHRSFVKNRERWFGACSKLAAANLSYQVLVAGDELVDHPLPTEPGTRSLLLLDSLDLTPADQQRLDQLRRRCTVFATLEQAIANLQPAVQIEGSGNVRVVPRTKAGAAVVHLLNYDYDAAHDEVLPIRNVKLRVQLQALGLSDPFNCTLYAPGKEPLALQPDQNRILVPELGLWSVLRLESRR